MAATKRLDLEAMVGALTTKNNGGAMIAALKKLAARLGLAA
ncbi:MULTISPECIES: hypothetical protein [Candidatus Accumulibacter]|uniref:Uncharacterized protein n=2 Tax=Candidatus Accumulibacter TaxID=327159 RepID=A0A080ML62_9PROT|nr:MULTISPECIES: hypothetical protein [Candidatus Accumulibacter]KFB78369.1 MAG: hypothetical protein AW06_000320 [Candidatus Accumulibacter cognatus]TMQ77753.1 hypothetical protein ACCUM_2700 [Candidatus Accumulibacter phosphatis]